MNHYTTADFWICYNALPESVRKVADANYALFHADPRYPSLHFKRIGELWSVRVGIGLPAAGDRWRRWPDLVLDRPARGVRPPDPRRVG